MQRRSLTRAMNLTVATLATLCILPAAWARADGLPHPLPAQPLADALDSFARETGVQILYNPELATGVSSHRVDVNASTEQALRELLRDTGLTFEFVNSRTVTLRPAAAPPSSSTDGAEPSAPKPTAQTAADLEEVVVTGSHIRGVQDGPSPVKVISRQQIDRLGAVNAMDILRSVPENFGGGIGVETSMAGVPTQHSQSNRGEAAGINLRGLGSDATLVLLNGHRLPQASEGFSVDIAAIPIDIVDHVDILKDGASSIYGSDAVAGAVNFVTRRDFTGAQTKLTAGGVTDGNKHDEQVSQLLGAGWSSGNLLASYTYDRSGSLSTEYRPATELALRPSDVYPTVTTHSIFVAATQEVASRLTLSSDILFSDRSLHPEIALQGADEAGNTLFAIHRRDISDDALIATASASFDTGTSWRIDGSAQYDRSRTRYEVGPIFTFTAADIRYRGSLSELGLRTDGTLLELPGGPLKAAFGASHRTDRYGEISSYSLDSTVNAGFAELHIPLFAAPNESRLLKRLEVTLADRYEDYSQFGSTNNPKVGLLWSPVSSLIVKSTYSTSFRAPLLAELTENPNNNVDILFVGPDPLSAGGQSIQLYRLGGNSNLRPETAHSLTAGLEITPESFPGLRVEANYFRIDFKDRIESPGGGSPQLQPDLYGAFLLRNPSVEEVNAIASSPYFVSIIGPLVPSDVVLIADARLQNLTAVNVSGIDLDMQYRRPLARGVIHAELSGSYFLEYSQTLVPGEPSVDQLNTPYYPVDMRLRANVDYTLGAWAFGATVNHTGSYEDNRTASDIVPIGSWTTFDARVAYGVSDGRSSDSPSFSVQLTLQNLLDRQPPYVANPTPPGITSYGFNYDPANASILGRYASLRLSKRW